ncbi:acyl-CoA dehydrogenase [Arthrobacter stackebrandtii]|uniref:Acyl-[acyl-carrier-protein] dehydrogenase MbtN n=1 Tax=Arthrobacter stackebrandtii TaxID=272161 RepID=A0ABS4YXW2_9MICC|nr:acyl-CoA dehydrogenase family protein [Arthrobacter stackebrandtii]MBP2413650.1 acyl-CoA dehydrogenase [Arthrobacter stackebrandtii]PYG99955.1 acyl-CoA dehydrogenase [Arthrobacter stackebrandtii]
MSTTEFSSPWIDEDLHDVAALAKEFFTKEVSPLEPKAKAQGFPDKALYARAGELGLCGMSIPEEYGGGGGTFANLAVLLQEQTKADAGSLGFAVSEGIVAHYLLAYASEEQKKRWLPKLCSGEWVGAVAMTEPGTGSDLQAVTTRAVRDGGDYLVTGSKIFISNGQLCDLVIIVAKTDTSQGAKGISLLVAEVDGETPGFQRGSNLEKVGMKGQDTSELFFDNLRVPAGNVLGGQEGQGFYQLMQQLPQERLITAILAQSMSEAAVAATLEYTKTREAFGKPLFELQNTRFELAECATITRVNRVFLDDCISRHANGGLDAATASMAKYWITDRTSEVVDRCQQLFGGYGYMMEYPIAGMYLDNRVLRVLAGANEVMKELIARSL